MKIAVVCDVLGSENNGTTVAAMNLIRYLIAQGHDVRVICADQDRKGAEGFYVAPTRNFGIFNGYVQKVGVTLAKKDYKLIERALDGVDYVHCMLPFALGKLAAKYCQSHNIPVSAGFHMQAQNLTAYLKVDKLKFLNNLIYRRIYHTFYRHVDGIHYPTEFIKDEFERGIKRKTNGYVISNGVNEEMIRRDVKKPPEYDGQIVILTTGRYAREKAQDVLIKAVAKCRNSQKIRLILAGHGVKEREFKKLAKKLPVKPVFKFFTRQEICDVLNYCDIYVHPAEVELEGIACLEALALGKFTIVSDSPDSATRSFAADESCTFKNRKPKDLARVLDYWIDHPGEREIYRKKYAEMAETLRQGKCMAKMEEMFEDLKNKKNTAEIGR